MFIISFPFGGGTTIWLNSIAAAKQETKINSFVFIYLSFIYDY